MTIIQFSPKCNTSGNSSQYISGTTRLSALDFVLHHYHSPKCNTKWQAILYSISGKDYLLQLLAFPNFYLWLWLKYPYQLYQPWKARTRNQPHVLQNCMVKKSPQLPNFNIFLLLTEVHKYFNYSYLFTQSYKFKRNKHCSLSFVEHGLSV